MGNSNSTRTGNGSLKGGATAPPLPAVTLPPPPNKAKKYKVHFSKQKKGGDHMDVTIGGDKVTIHIPDDKKPGDTFVYNAPPQTNKVFATTLPSVPGMEIVQTKPTIWGVVSLKGSSVENFSFGNFLEKAQEQLLGQAVNMECNAVLNLTFNINTDSSGEYGEKSFVVTAFGTPCIILPASKACPVAQPCGDIVPPTRPAPPALQPYV